VLRLRTTTHTSASAGRAALCLSKHCTTHTCKAHPSQGVRARLCAPCRPCTSRVRGAEPRRVGGSCARNASWITLTCCKSRCTSCMAHPYGMFVFSAAAKAYCRLAARAPQCRRRTRAAVREGVQPDDARRRAPPGLLGVAPAARQAARARPLGRVLRRRCRRAGLRAGHARRGAAGAAGSRTARRRRAIVVVRQGEVQDVAQWAGRAAGRAAGSARRSLKYSERGRGRAAVARGRGRRLILHYDGVLCRQAAGVVAAGAPLVVARAALRRRRGGLRASRAHVRAGHG